MAGLFYFRQLHYLYLLYTPLHNKYYLGISDNPQQRLLTHNTTERSTFISKYRPWQLAAVFEAGSLENARTLENFIKKQKSRELLEKLADLQFEPQGRLAPWEIQLLKYFEGTLS